MSYGVRRVSPDGKTGNWTAPFATRQEAEEHAALRQMENGLSYTVEEVTDVPPKPEPTSTTERLVRLLRDRHAWGLAKYGTTLDRGDLTPEQWAEHAIDEALDLAGYLTRLKDEFGQEPGSTATHHVEILRQRVKALEAMVETLRNKLNETLTDNDDIHRDLAFALDLGRAMREAMRTGEWRAGHDRSMANSAVAGWDRWKGSLAKAPSVPVGASEAPGEGGDSDRRRLEALERWLKGDTCRMVYFSKRQLIVAISDSVMDETVAPTLAALADKLAEKEAKP